jgi:hypothetical protein
LTFAGIAIGYDPHAQMAHFALLSHDRHELARGPAVGGSRCKRPPVSLLKSQSTTGFRPDGRTFEFTSNFLAVDRGALCGVAFAPLRVNKWSYARHTCMEKTLLEQVRHSNEPFNSGVEDEWSSKTPEEERPHIDGLEGRAFHRSRTARSPERCRVAERLLV